MYSCLLVNGSVEQLEDCVPSVACSRPEAGTQNDIFIAGVWSIFILFRQDGLESNAIQNT